MSTLSIQLHLGAAIYLFFFSTFYHVLFCVSERVSKVLLRCDYSGICVIAAGACIPAYHYGFYCQPEIMNACVKFSIFICITMSFFSLMEFIHVQSFVVWKASIFVSYFGIHIVPIMVLVIFKYVFHELRFSVGHLDFKQSEEWFLHMDVILVGGAIIYAGRIPERWFPNKFDYLVPYIR